MRLVELSLALTHLKPKRRRGFINLIGLIAVGGVAVSVAGILVVVSVMNGFQRDIRDRIIGTNAHVMVRAYAKEGIPDWQELIRKVEKMPGVLAAAPYYQGQVMLKSGSGVTGVLLQGIQPERQTRIARLRQSMKDGSPDLLERPQAGEEGPIPILLGVELRNSLDVVLGEELTLFSPVFRSTAVGMVPRMAKVRVAGSFQTGYYEYDSSLLYMGLADAQKLFDSPGAVNQIGVKLDDMDKAEATAAAIQALDKGVTFWAADWQRMNANLFKALAMEKVVMFLILGCMVLVSAVNIVSTLVMVVMERQKEIGVLRSLGASAMGVLRIFLAEGLLIGSAGAALGFALGLGICGFLKVYPLKIPGGGSVYYIETLPVDVQRGDLLAVAALAFVMCLLAAAYPARKAAGLDPVEAMRYE